MAYYNQPATLEIDGGTLVYRTPYNPGLVAALKAQVPASDRKWDPALKAWLVAPAHGRLLRDLTAQHLGELLSIPQGANTAAPLETRLLDVRYIGVCKERGNGERSAFGWCAGEWSIVFPEAALRAWFNSETRPDEAPTLYSVLGLKRDANASQVKSAYRRLARQWHPDVSREPDAQEQFIAIQHAYEVLGDGRTRARYDAGLTLSATVTAPRRQEAPMSAYRSPLRCGYVLATGRDTIGRFVVEQVLAWEDIARADGRVLSTSWPAGGTTFVEQWV